MTLQISAMREQNVPISAVCIDEGYIVFANGLVLPITGFYDEYDDEVEDREEAVYYEAGDDEHGYVRCPMADLDICVEKGMFH
jgi:hypothetical protein